MKYDAVIFDLFGTLVDNTEFLVVAGAEYHRTLSKVAAALSVPEPDLLRLWSETVHERDSGFFPTMEDYFQHICRECDSELMCGNYPMPWNFGLSTYVVFSHHEITRLKLSLN